MVLDRLWTKTTVVDGHRIWNGASNARGGGKGKPRDEANRYGTIRFEGRQRPTHVVAYLLLVGPLPPDKPQVHHGCEVTLCWEPTHLKAATPKENLMASDTPARRNAEKTHCKRGHEFTPENTYAKRLRGGRSVARECRRCAADRRRDARRA